MKQRLWRRGEKRFLSRHFFLFYFCYAFLSGVLFFALPPRNVEVKPPFLLKDYAEFGPSFDRVALISTGEESIAVRLDLIRQAESSIEIAYHSLHKGVVAEVFYGALLEAADRGVHVRILMDGLFHRLYGSMRELKYVLEAHPNIEFRLYEPFSLFNPKRWHNRLHDKIMIIDGKTGLISGRNIGDRYYLTEDFTKDFVLDLDVVVYSRVDADKSGVNQLSEYFSLLWEHPYSREMKFRLTAWKRKKGEKFGEAFKQRLQELRQEFPAYFQPPANLEERSVAVKGMQLIHNPITRGRKEPWVWATLVELASRAKERIIVQSPYFIPTKGMLKYLEEESLAGKEVLLVTNSLASSPNLFGVAGYHGKRGFLGNWATEIWEYYGPGSLHGKAVLFDNNLSAVGSFNMDARSSFLSTETMLVIESEEFNQHLKEVISSHAKYSQPVLRTNKLPKAPWYKRLIVGVVRLFSWCIDYLL